MIDKEKNHPIDDLKLTLGEEYKLKLLPVEKLQKVVDSIVTMVEPALKKYFPDLDVKELNKVEVEFVGGIKLQYPEWLISRRGKTILNEVYNEVFTSPIINFTTLFKALKKINLFPIDLVKKLSEIKTSSAS